MKLRTHNETVQVLLSLGPKKQDCTKLTNASANTDWWYLLPKSTQESYIEVWITLSCSKAQGDSLIPSVNSAF